MFSTQSYQTDDYNESAPPIKDEEGTQKNRPPAEFSTSNSKYSSEYSYNYSSVSPIRVVPEESDSQIAEEEANESKPVVKRFQLPTNSI